jgi:hypothetical protein
MTVDGNQLEELWRAAAARASTSAFRTAAVGTDAARGPVLAGVDRADRPGLLVPISPRHTLEEDVEGRSVTLRRRALEDEQSFRTYACLELVDPRLGDLFTALCVEIVEQIAATPDRAVAALRKVLTDWRALLAGAREALSPAALAGLFGELLVLRRVLEADPGAVALWTGPTRRAQDFHKGTDAVEVKTTVAPEGRRITVHGVGQLDVAPPGRLVLSWLRLRTDRGVSVPELVDDILAVTDDPPTFRNLLLASGYRESEREIYARRRFEVVEERTYQVGPGFPRIVPAGLAGDATLAGVGPIDYIVDLDSAAAEAQRIDRSGAIDVLVGRT